MIWKLSFLILLPLAEILTAILSKKHPLLHKSILLSIIGISIAVAVSLPISQEIYHINLGFFDLKFMCDIYSYFFGILVIVIWFLTNLYTYSYGRIIIARNRLITFFKKLSLSIFAVLGGCYAADLWTMFIFFTLLTIFTADLIIQKPSKSSLKAQKIYLFTHLGTSLIFFLPAIILLEYSGAKTDFVISDNNILLENRYLASFILFLFVFGISKNCIFPFGKWITYSTVAPNPVSALLHSVAAVKSGSIAIIKIIVYIFGMKFTNSLTSNFLSGGWIFYLCGLTAILASIQALRTTDIKKRFSYSTISQLSYIMSSVMIAVPIAIIGAILYIISHSLCKVILFYIAGIFNAIYKTRDIKQINKIAPYLKFWIICLTFAGASIIGFPLLPGSYGKDYMIISGLQTHHYAPLIFLITGSVINILYIYPTFKAAFFTKNPEKIIIKTIPLTMRLAILLGLFLSIIMTFYISDLVKFLAIYV